ncbi:uncharacterized protein LOC112341988 [Selaginella moellendorffii]|uniref:uncharacterized protein LOC112341988 n=1 Tax=Selaginella moellendorffii TaxID=88036 RepID=UPI000D1C583F|nr:uncharacterized protein LOC112341988 [Selaginella moellendorffii]|eukprot:XP_024518832.1 uncharacterized protein LOC112341988 [Selaginella moellendorffii]
MCPLTSPRYITLKFRVSVLWYTSFGEFRDGQSLRQYASNILEDCSVIDFERLGVLYRGRYRAFVTALEQYILSNPPATAATEFFLDYAKKTTSMRGASASTGTRTGDFMHTVNRTVLDDVYRFFSGVPSDELAAAKALVQSVVANHFFGTGKMVVLNPTLSLVEFGLGRVCYKGHGLMKWVYQDQDGIIGHADASEECQAVEIFEPLVCCALWHYFQENSSLQRIQQHHFLDKAELSASSTGEVYETAVAEMIAEHLDGKYLADLFSSWNTQPIPAIYNNTATLARPKVDHLKLVGTETEDFRLIDWINSVTSGEDDFFTFFSTGRNKTCGPDIWWFLTVTQRTEPEQADKLQCAGEPSSGEQADDLQSVTTFIICAAQMKTLQKMARGDYQKAISSLDLNKLFLHKNGGQKVVTRKKDDEGAKRVRELASFGCLKLVVTTDFVDLTKFQPKAKQNPAKLRKLNTPHCQQECVPAILGVIDSTNICMFVERCMSRKENQNNELTRVHFNETSSNSTPPLSVLPGDNLVPVLQQQPILPLSSLAKSSLLRLISKSTLDREESLQSSHHQQEWRRDQESNTRLHQRTRELGGVPDDDIRTNRFLLRAGFCISSFPAPLSSAGTSSGPALVSMGAKKNIDDVCAEIWEQVKEYLPTVPPEQYFALILVAARSYVPWMAGRFYY